tara:strand:+ start:895 stop:1692 length:798 start_codon:yes stop_codon:yes gene_type:complete
MTTGTVSKAAVPFSQYLNDPAVGASMIKIMCKAGPEVYYRTIVDPAAKITPPTPAMLLGSLVHCAVLEPTELEARYEKCGPRNTKAGKEEATDIISRGLTPVTHSDWDLMEGMVDAIRSHDAASSLFAEGQPENSYWWDDKASGLCCKCRCDWVNGSTIIDLKTTVAGGASPKEFAKTVTHFGYHLQAAHYLRSGAGTRFVFVAVEKAWPFTVGLYELDQEAIDLGNEQIDKALAQIAECYRSNQWPGYAEEITTLNLPRWAYSQ